MLVIHGGKDYRVPLIEGLSTFTALLLKGIPSKFLFFPMENHWALNPHNQIKWYQQVLDFIEVGSKKKIINFYIIRNIKIFNIIIIIIITHFYI